MHSFEGKKVLVTGINGFIGSHLARALHEQGAILEGTSRTPAQTPYLDTFFPHGEIPVQMLNLRKTENISRMIEKKEYDYIYHLASQSDTWNSTQIPIETFETNVNGTLYLLDALRKSKSNTPIIIAGSVRAFEPLTSSKVDVMAPLHPYDASKFCMQVMALSYFNAYHLSGAIAQNTNIYGPNDRNFNRLIPKMMKTLFNQKKILLKGNGQIKRDFLHVKDAVKGMLSIGSRIHKKEVNQKSITFASGKLSTIREVSQLIEEHFPYPVEIGFDGHPFEDRDHSLVDISTACQRLEWAPEYSLGNGLKETIEWYQHFFNGGIQL